MALDMVSGDCLWAAGNFGKTRGSIDGASPVGLLCISCVFGRFDLAALCGCHTLNVCCFVVTGREGLLTVVHSRASYRWKPMELYHDVPIVTRNPGIIAREYYTVNALVPSSGLAKCTQGKPSRSRYTLDALG